MDNCKNCAAPMHSGKCQYCGSENYSSSTDPFAQGGKIEKKLERKETRIIERYERRIEAPEPKLKWWMFLLFAIAGIACTSVILYWISKKISERKLASIS